MWKTIEDRVSSENLNYGKSNHRLKYPLAMRWDQWGRALGRSEVVITIYISSNTLVKKSNKYQITTDVHCSIRSTQMHGH